LANFSGNLFVSTKTPFHDFVNVTSKVLLCFSSQTMFKTLADNKRLLRRAEAGTQWVQMACVARQNLMETLPLENSTVLFAPQYLN
jgi:hypothetical protein